MGHCREVSLRGGTVHCVLSLTHQRGLAEGKGQRDGVHTPSGEEEKGMALLSLLASAHFHREELYRGRESGRLHESKFALTHLQASWGGASCMNRTGEGGRGRRERGVYSREDHESASLPRAGQEAA